MARDCDSVPDGVGPNGQAEWYFKSAPEVQEFLRSELKRQLRKAHRRGDVAEVKRLRVIRRQWNTEDGV